MLASATVPTASTEAIAAARSMTHRCSVPAFPNMVTPPLCSSGALPGAGRPRDDAVERDAHMPVQLGDVAGRLRLEQTEDRLVDRHQGRVPHCAGTPLLTPGR